MRVCGTSGDAGLASSSLHAIIICTAFGIQAVLVEFSDLVVGGGFKFRDFYASIHAATPSPSPGEGNSSDVACRPGGCDPIDLDLDKLLAACPFAQSTLTR